MPVWHRFLSPGLCLSLVRSRSPIPPNIIFSLSHQGVTAPIVGTTSLENLYDLLGNNSPFTSRRKFHSILKQVQSTSTYLKMRLKNSRRRIDLKQHLAMHESITLQHKTTRKRYSTLVFYETCLAITCEFENTVYDGLQDSTLTTRSDEVLLSAALTGDTRS